jgi:hypothetical protein
MKLCKGKYEPKVPPTSPCILKRRNGWMIIPIHPCLLNILICQLQATGIMLHVGQIHIMVDQKMHQKSLFLHFFGVVITFTMSFQITN